MENFWLTEAISNNAEWCNAIAASHGIPTSWNESTWLSEHPMPPFYPNIVTLKSGALIGDQIDTMISLLSSGWGIKDSYSELTLEGIGFTLAFEAQWYCRLPTQHSTETLNSDAQLKTVQSPSELHRWVAAWGEGNGIFETSLLENNAIELVFVERDNKVISGLATNKSGDSIGISNAFGADEDILRCVALIAAKYPVTAIVGYGDTAEVVTLSTIGFKPIGELRVWLRD